MNILFIGLGNLGSQVVDLFLLRSAADQHFFVAGRNTEYIRRRTSLPLYAAMQLGLTPNLDYVYMDVQNVDQTAETIAQIKPDVIFTSVTVQASSAISKLPGPLFEKLARAQAGPWMPLTLVLLYKLMRAVKVTGLNIAVLNAASSDNAHAVLGKIHLAPTVGTGNLANLIPALRKLIAHQLKSSWEQVQVLFIGHNQVATSLRTKGTPGIAPFHLATFLNGEDVTSQLNLSSLFQQLPETTHEYTQLVSASSVAIAFDAVIGKIKGTIHAPGPNGLPGAYPLQKGENGLDIVLPPGLTLQEAIHINQEGQKLDGIERIEDDGTVYFTEQNMAILTETFGYSCRRMLLSEVEDRAKELHAKYRAFAQRYE